MVANKVPRDVGFSVEMNWTASLLKKWIKQDFDVEYSLRGALNLLHLLEFSSLKKLSEIKQQHLDGRLNRILFQDESMIRDYQTIHRTWFPKGRQRIVKTYGKHRGVKLIGVLDCKSGEVFCVHLSAYDAQEFLNFLQLVLKKYPQQKIIMILDNAKIHNAKLIQPFLKEYKCCLELLVFLPPYNPNLNPIEPLWGWLKRTCIYNVFYKSVAQITKAVQDFLAEINRNP